MTDSYVILERTDLGKNGIVALPSCSQDISQIFRNAGEIQALETDFSRHNHWPFDFLSIYPIGSLSNPRDATLAAVNANLDAICKETSIDASYLRSDPTVRDAILDYETLEGNIFIARFTEMQPLPEGREPERASAAYFASPSDGSLSWDGKQLSLDGTKQEILDWQLSYLMGGSRQCIGELEVFKAGSASLHRRTLKPYKSEGRYGSECTNGPWIVLRSERSVREEIERFAL